MSRSMSEENLNAIKERVKIEFDILKRIIDDDTLVTSDIFAAIEKYVRDIDDRLGIYLIVVGLIEENKLIVKSKFDEKYKNFELGKYFGKQNIDEIFKLLRNRAYIQLSREEIGSIRLINELIRDFAEISDFIIAKNRYNNKDYGFIIFGGNSKITSGDVIEFIKFISSLVGHIKRRIEWIKLNRKYETEKSMLDVLMNNLPDHIYFKDTELRFIRISKSHADSLGLKRPEDAIGKSDFDFFDYSHAKEAFKDERKILSTKESIIGRPELVSYMGKKRWMLTTKVPYIDKDGNLRGLVGISRDITAIKEYEDRIRESESRLKKLIEYANFIIFIIDVAGNIKSTNSAAEKMLKMDRKDLIGKKLQSLMSESSREKFGNFLKNINKEGMFSSELELIRKDGEIIIVDCSATAIKNRANEVVEINVYQHDISERKMVEEVLRKAKEESEMVNRQLELAIQHANRMALEAELANQAKSEFLATMSHEIRTPLNGIIGMTDLLLETDLTKEQRDYVEIIKKSGEILLNVINEILDFSKIEAGKMEIESTDFNIYDIIENVVQSQAIKSYEKGLEIVSFIDPAVPEIVIGDPGHLQQILTNLIGNAIKFTGEGEVSITARLQSATDSECEIYFEVKDTGVGIPKDKIQEIFSPFKQADSSTTRKYGGTGLGLSICKKLVEMMGGQIGVESEVGKGSKFWFFIKVKLPKEVKKKKILLKYDLKDKRVIVVDDNHTNRKFLSMLLEKWGMKHVEFGDPKEVIPFLKEELKKGIKYDLAILDMAMPGMSGDELGRLIKADSQLTDMKLIMLSSLGKSVDTKRLENIGFSAYLIKPVKQSQLFNSIAYVFGKEALKPIEEDLIKRTGYTKGGRKVKILVTEDNETNQMVAKAMLTKLGFDVDIAASGKEAIEKLKSDDYDLVFMDIEMPGLDGFETTERIRKSKKVKNPNVPIIAMSAHVLKWEKDRSLEAGMNDYITKPIQSGTLIDVINKYLKLDKEKKKEEKRNKEGIVVFDANRFNSSELLEKLMGDEDVLLQVLDTFKTGAQKRIAKLEKLIKENKFEEARKESHTLKGSAFNISAYGFGNIAKNLENACINKKFDEAMKLLTELKEEFDYLLKVLK